MSDSRSPRTELRAPLFWFQVSGFQFSACYARIMRDRSDADWEELARREPYFAVLTNERFLSDGLSDERLQEFFVSGEADVQRLLDLASSHLAAPFAPRH